MRTNSLASTALHACLKPWVVLAAAALCPLAHAAIIVPGADGSDGALNITTDTVIDLSQAVDAAWDTNNAANAGKGVYDAAKWAVVFKYTNVTVATGAIVTFKNHASRAPVVWLVSGNVTINGTVSLDGQAGATPPLLAEPGPGGFRGGCASYAAGVTMGSGLGAGGGSSRIGNGAQGAGGSYGTLGNVGTTVHGNPALLPLIGGSGGGGGASRWGETGGVWGGGGGGGAMLIACANTLAVAGEIRSNGGAGTNNQWESGSGSGGGIRLLADSLSGAGKLNAVGGTASYYGGSGRIRIERIINNNTITVVPAPSTVDLTAGATALLWPATGSPDVRVVSIGAVNAPSDPRAAFGTYDPDVALPLVATTQVIVETVNVEQASQVKVRITPRDSANYTEIAATYSSTVSASPLTLRWTATVPTTTGYSAVQARVIRP